MKNKQARKKKKANQKEALEDSYVGRKFHSTYIMVIFHYFNKLYTFLSIFYLSELKIVRRGPE